MVFEATMLFRSVLLSAFIAACLNTTAFSEGNQYSKNYCNKAGECSPTVTVTSKHTTLYFEAYCGTESNPTEPEALTCSSHNMFISCSDYQDGPGVGKTCICNYKSNETEYKMNGNIACK